ncbi:carbohydrate-binding domain-containing protein [Microvirga arabica]|uniref:carbohydrate-binding domain-containing protein n=1 Tax=Microvirga arabica TaxID=1128671 RepID=UPI00193990E4|nr:carbohydrate-binding domain-containing protein [Microvirga arabica]MBM1175590.1 hypothetical protein [Microvirga arabica]
MSAPISNYHLVLTDELNALSLSNSRTFTGNFDAAGTQSHRVGIKFDNNLSGSGGDRNLYVDEVTFKGQVDGSDALLTMNGAKHWDFML